MKSHTRAKSLTEHPEKAVAQYPRGATLGTLDLIADVSFSGASLRFCCYLSAWSSGAGAFYYYCYCVRREAGCFAHMATRLLVRYFCHFTMWPYCYVTSDVGFFWGDHRGTGAPSEGTGAPSEAPGHGLMSAFYIPLEPQAYLHLQNFTHTVFHACLRTSDVVVNKKLGRQ